MIALPIIFPFSASFFNFTLPIVDAQASQGVYEDLSGPEISRLLDEANSARTESGPNDGSGEFVWGIGTSVVVTGIVPDEIGMYPVSQVGNLSVYVLIKHNIFFSPAAIQAKVLQWIDCDQSIDLLLTTGGTGFGRRDLTPEAIRPLLQRCYFLIYTYISYL